jgi:peptidoglycan-associated lipoprotein
MKKIYHLLAFSLFIQISAFAQPADGNTPAALLKSGDEQIEKGQYYNALDQYEKAYKALKEKDIAIKIARTHFLLRDYARASNFYNRVLARDKNNTYFEERFNFAKALKMNGNTTEAAAEFNKYIESGADPNLKEMAKKELAGIELMGSMKENLVLKIKNAGKQINTPESQASPALNKEGALYYGTIDYKTDEGKEEKADRIFSKLVTSNFTEGKGWSKPTELPETINRPGYHTSNVSFSKDGNTMYYTRTVSDGGMAEESKIYASTQTGSGWSPALEVTGVNGNYLAKHPVEGELFGNKVLFFSANIEGGKGGFDIYYANKTGEGEFATPLPLSDINTAGNEETPYYVDGKLYFSSDGWPGFGGYDVFSSKWNGSSWELPMNLGAPVNTTADDLYFKIDEFGNKGFLVSNRPDPESKSLKSKTCCDDIYTIEKRKLIIELLSTIKDEAGKPIKGATVQLIEMASGKDGQIESKPTLT